MSPLFFRRVGAYLIDVVVLFVVLAPAGLVAQYLLGMRPQTGPEIWIALLCNFSLPAWAYFAVSDGSAAGATAGKWMFGIRVCTSDGRVPWLRAVLRTAVKLLPWELTHVSAFALSDDSAEIGTFQLVGLWAANLLAIAYLGAAALTGGRRSVHDFVARTFVWRHIVPGAFGSDRSLHE